MRTILAQLWLYSISSFIDWLYRRTVLRFKLKKFRLTPSRNVSNNFEKLSNILENKEFKFYTFNKKTWSKRMKTQFFFFRRYSYTHYSTRWALRKTQTWSLPGHFPLAQYQVLLKQNNKEFCCCGTFIFCLSITQKFCLFMPT